MPCVIDEFTRKSLAIKIAQRLDRPPHPTYQLLRWPRPPWSKILDSTSIQTENSQGACYDSDLTGGWKRRESQLADTTSMTREKEKLLTNLPSNSTNSSRPVHLDKTGWRVWLPSVALFQFIFIIAYVHRQILNIIVGPVKVSLGLSDFQIGLLQGVALTLVITAMIILTAPIIDKGNRVRFLGICMIIWSAMTVCSGFAQNFGMLLASRTGLAMAEAAVPMAVMSLICDIVPRSSVPRAAALFMAGPFLGSGFMLLAGGPLLAWLEYNQTDALPLFGLLEPWRSLFVILGTPGIVIAFLVLLLVREPARKGDNQRNKKETASVLPFLWANASFFFSLVLFTSAVMVFSYTVYAWMPTYMIRVHGLDVKNAGLKVGTIFVVAGTAGSVFGSWIMSRRANHEALGQVVRSMVGLSFLYGPLFVLTALAPTATSALVLLAIAFFLLAASMTSVVTPQALFAPAHLRAQVIAVSAACNAVLGGLGPIIVGGITDFFFKSPNRIYDSLAITFAGAFFVMCIAGPRAARLATQIDKMRSPEANKDLEN